MLHQTYYRHLIGQDPIILKRFFTVKLFRCIDLREITSEENTVIWSLHFVILMSSYCNLEYCVSLLSSNQMFVGLFGNDNPFGMPPVCAQ